MSGLKAKNSRNLKILLKSLSEEKLKEALSLLDSEVLKILFEEHEKDLIRFDILYALLRKWDNVGSAIKKFIFNELGIDEISGLDYSFAGIYKIYEEVEDIDSAMILENELVELMKEADIVELLNFYRKCNNTQYRNISIKQEVDKRLKKLEPKEVKKMIEGFVEK